MRAVPASGMLIHAFPRVPGLDHVLAMLLVKSQQVAVSADGRHACEVVLEADGSYRLLHSSARLFAAPFRTALVLGVSATAARVYARRGNSFGLYDVDGQGATPLEECATFPRVASPPVFPEELRGDDGEARARLVHDGIQASWVEAGTERFGPYLLAWNLHLDDEGHVVFNAIGERGIMRVTAR